MTSECNVPSFECLLSPDAEVIHRTRRALFEKRIVALSAHRYVLYRFPVPWRARKLAAMLREGERLGIPMQRCEGVAAGWRDLVRYGGCWVVASYESGEPFKASALNDGLVGSFASSLARLHSLRARRHGPLLQYGNPLGSLADEVSAALGIALECADRNEADEKREMSRWLGDHGGFLRDTTDFHLVHGDLLSKNLLVRDGGNEICLIDYELASFDHAGFELAQAMIRFFGGRNRKFRAAFLDCYLSECDPAVARDWNSHSPYFLVSAALRLAQTRVRRRRKLLSRGQSDEADAQTERFDSFVAIAFSMMHAHRAGARTPDEMLGVGMVRQPARARPSA